jgi:broad specificity phosphatase PhoE/8-oxo-dGTP pyrophosphatase MutT (NUDIX family)
VAEQATEEGPRTDPVHEDRAAAGLAEVRAAGGVLWRRVDGQVCVAVVHRPRYDDWSLPKGKLDPGELDLAGAVREVAEETGFSSVVRRSLGSSRYRVVVLGRDVPKTVRWWSLEALEGRFAPNDEVDDLRWLPVPEAARTVTAGRDDGVLARFAATPPETTPVLLVRHARAGSRQAWAGPDDERPLDDRGRRQAAALADLLALWRPARVLSAPAARCTQTVAPLARSLGLPVELEHDLAETAGPGALVARLRALGASGSPVVACSQGGVIGAAVAHLAHEAGLRVTDPDAPKGAVWALGFAEGRLVDTERTDVSG